MKARVESGERGLHAPLLAALLLGILLLPGPATVASVSASGPGPAVENGSPLPSQPPRPEDVVELDVALETTPLVRGTDVRAAVELRIGERYHVNANPPTYDYLIPTTVTVEGLDGVEVATEHHPEPVPLATSFSDDPLDVYEGRTVIGLSLRVGTDAPLGSHDLAVVVRYQACDERACFAPTRVRLQVPVVVGAAGTSPETTDDPLLERAPFPDRGAEDEPADRSGTGP